MNCVALYKGSVDAYTAMLYSPISLKGDADMNKFNYETPVGTFRTWEEAMTACERCDLDPCTCISAVEA